ncbi:MAG: hypothetical protein R3C59_18625 [Planctomycetaceae bacterium]
MDKLKNILMQHGEKLLAGFVGLLGFMAITSASWSTDNRIPDELVTKSKAAEDQIKQNIWPDEEKVALREIKDVRKLTAVEAKFKLDPTEYQIGAINPSLIRSREKRTSVVVVPPTIPVSDYVVFTLAMPPEKEDADAEGETDADGVKIAAADTPKEEGELTEDEAFEKMMERKFGKKKDTVGMGMMDGAVGLGGEYAGAEGGMADMAAMMGQMSGYETGAGAGYEDMYGGSELFGMYGAEMMSVKKRVRVSAGVSVRFVVDLSEQRSAIRNALHLSSDVQEAQQYIKYVDIQVQRRQEQEGPEPWGPWQDVTSEDLGEILEDSFGIDRDVVSPAVTRNTITMPLPRRATGTWDPAIASHPRVEKFELSDKEKALIDRWNQMVTERLAEEAADAPIVVEEKGFSNFVTSATDATSMYGGMGMYSGMGMEGSMPGGAGGGYEDMYSAYESSMGGGKGGKLTAAERARLDETQATADMRLLLVRFMDFTVERGYAYQYRVRLEMKNPNYNHPLDELEDPSLGTEATLVSDWSEPTPATTVPKAHHLYVTDVEARPGRQEAVDVTIYTDTTETGLPVMGQVKVYAGMPIAGRRKQPVVDLTQDKLEDIEVTLSTDGVLVAAQGIDRMSSSDHPDLKAVLSGLERGATIVPSQICLVDSDGELKLRSIGDRRKEEINDKKEAEFILEKYEAWRPKKASDGGGFFGPGGAEGGGYEGSEGSAYMGMSSGSSAVGGYFGGGMGMMGGGESGRNESSRGRGRSGRSGGSSRP